MPSGGKRPQPATVGASSVRLSLRCAASLTVCAHMTPAVHPIRPDSRYLAPDAGVSGLGCTVWALASLSVRGVVSAQ